MEPETRLRSEFKSQLYTRCVILDKLLSPSEIQFPHWQNTDDRITFYRDFREVMPEEPGMASLRLPWPRVELQGTSFLLDRE